MEEGAEGWVEEVAEQDEEVAEVVVVGASQLQVALTKLWLKRGLLLQSSPLRVIVAAGNR